MEPLPRLQARIASLEEFRDLIHALRALAAAHLQEAQAALPGIRRYVDVIEDAIAEGVNLLPPDDAPRAGPAAAGGALIVVCSEHGFAGNFNERLLEHAQARRRERQDLVVIGRRGAALAAESGLDVTTSFSMATHVSGVVGVTRRVADHLAEVSSAKIVFGNYRKGGSFTVEAMRILPLDPALLVRSDRRSAPVHHLPPDILLRGLASEYLFAEITRAVMESFASENASRLRVMETADHNIADKLDAFHRTERTLRQEAITTELLDVVTGSEAIMGAAGR